MPPEKNVPPPSRSERMAAMTAWREFPSMTTDGTAS